jgi:hypothetical protein
VARVALGSLLIIAFDNGPNIDVMPETATEFIRRQSAEKYNSTIPEKQKVFITTAMKRSEIMQNIKNSVVDFVFFQVSAITVAAFESVLMFSQVVNESLTLTPSEPVSNGRSFAEKFLNQTFVLPTGQIYITPAGERLTDILVFQLDSAVGTIKVSTN